MKILWQWKKISRKGDSKLWQQYLMQNILMKWHLGIPDARRNKLLESGAIVRDKRLSDTFAGQTTTSYAEIPFYGNLEGAPDNYDGVTDITTDSTKTYLQGCFTYGRAHGWTPDGQKKILVMILLAGLILWAMSETRS